MGCLERPQCVTSAPSTPDVVPALGPEAGLTAPWHPWQEQSQGREELSSSSDPQPARQEIGTFLIAPLPLGEKITEKGNRKAVLAMGSW